ncbi:MAG: hypothetical protein FJ109_13545, partial [Deltaproteobacteria bacterium]|nr:hypothetical protein [Deltaproteobacteria bacterium]
MSELKNLALFLIERVSVILHWLAASYWGILLAAILLVLALFWVWILEKVLKHKLAARCNVPASCLSFGPISATVGWVMLGVGLFHVLLNVASRILGSGTGAYGPAGWVLGGLWLDDLVPVPYALGFPMAVAVYGYLYSVVLKARVEVVTGLNGPASAFVLALLCVPFLPISFVGSLAFRGVAKWWGRRELRKAERQRKKRKNGEEAGASGEKTDAADEAEGGGSAQEGVEKPPEEPVLPPPSLDGQPWTYLMVGHEVRYSDAHPALPFFRLLPRYKIAMNEGVTVAFAIVAALSIVSFFLPVTAEDVSFPDKRPFDAYKNTVSQIRAEENRGEEQGRKPLPLSPRPFDEVFPSLTVADVLQQLGGEMAKELPPLPDEAIQALEKLRDSGAGRTTINELLVAAKGKAASSLGVVLPVPARFALEKAADTFRVRLDVKDAEGLSAAYDCDGTTYDKLKEYVASRESGTELWARAVLNAALCRTVATPSLSFDAFRSLDAMLSDLTAAKLVSFQELELELADVREAARILGGTEDAARGWLLAGIIHKERRRVRDAQKLLGKAAAIWTDRPEDLAAGYLAVLEIADLLARLNRFGEAEDVLSDYASRVRSAAGDDRELIAFSKL